MSQVLSLHDNKHVWSPCIVCGKLRLMKLQGNNTQSSHCRSCANKEKWLTSKKLQALRIPIQKKDTLVSVECPRCNQKRDIKYGSYKRSIDKYGYFRNLCPQCGRKITATKNRGRLAWNRGLHNWQTEEHKTNRLKAITGRKLSQEHIDKLRASRKDKPLSMETRAKIGQAKQRYFASHPEAIAKFVASSHTAEALAKSSTKRKGRKLPLQQIEAIRKRLKEHNPFLGKKHSEADKFKMRRIRSQSFRETIHRVAINRPPMSDDTKRKIRETLARPEIRQVMSSKAKARSNGSGNSNWQGGLSFEPYGICFSESLKGKIRNRDNRICQLCGIGENGRKLSVHHIDYNKQNHDETNLIALCRECNIKVNYKRSYWQQYFQNFIGAKQWHSAQDENLAVYAI